MMTGGHLKRARARLGGGSARAPPPRRAPNAARAPRTRSSARCVASPGPSRPRAGRQAASCRPRATRFPLASGEEREESLRVYAARPETRPETRARPARGSAPDGERARARARTLRPSSRGRSRRRAAANASQRVDRTACDVDALSRKKRALEAERGCHFISRMQRSDPRDLRRFELQIVNNLN